MLRVIFAIVFLCTLHPAPSAAAQVWAFRYDSTRVPVGRLYEYLKSNRDGTHQGHVSLYVVSRSRIESLKWSPGDTTATLVGANLDWRTFSAAHLDSWRLVRGIAPRLQAMLDTDSSGGGVRLSFQPDSLIRISAWPWHSYDFDFASLNLALPHLAEPEGVFEFERADITYAQQGPPFADMGSVQVRFTGRDLRQGWSTRRYEISGPGLRGERGSLWAALNGGYLVEFELPFPDEPGYTDVRFRLLGMRALTTDEWERYKRDHISGEQR